MFAQSFFHRAQPKACLAKPTELSLDEWRNRLTCRMRRPCARSIVTFTQSFLHRAALKTRNPERGSRSALTVVVYISISPVPRARRCMQKEDLDQFTVGTSCSVTKPAEPSLHEPSRQTCKAEVVSQFHRLGQVGCSLSDWNLLRRMTSKNCHDYNFDTRLSGTLSNNRCVLIEE